MGKIVIENNQANKAIDDTTSKAQGLADSLGGSGSGGVAGMAQSMGSKVANVAGKVGTTVANAAKVVGKTVLAGTATAAAGITALTKQAVSAYADHEQLVGGVETLFKDSADTVKGYADEAFQTAGMSANEYMETVTSFSASLLQSLGGNTAKAADMANQAIIDMSDNANKMGTDISMIQNAYNGFAKQNYTMLDNLKLGYGGTKEEMARLLADATALSGVEYDLSSFADITEAIHVIQTEMGIAGTTAAEASSTISGSLQSVKSSWQNLLVGIADEDSDLGGLIGNLTDSAVTFAENLIPRIGEALGGIKNAVPIIAEKLAPILGEGVSSALGMIGIEVSPEQILSGLETAFNTAKDAITPIVEGIGETISANIEPAINTVQNFLAPLESIAKITFDNIKSIDWQQIFGDSVGLAEDISEAFRLAGEKAAEFVGICSQVFQSVDWNNIFSGAAKHLGTLATDLGNAAASALELTNTLSKPIANFLGGLAGQITAEGNAIGQAIDGVINKISSRIQDLTEAIEALNAVLSGADEAAGKVAGVMADASKVAGNAAKKATGSGNLSGIVGVAIAPLAIAAGTKIANKVNTSINNSIDDPYGVMNMNADGAIFSKATIFGRANGKLQVAGEAGAEAVAPIDVLQGYVSSAVAEQVNVPQAAVAESIAVMTETMNAGFDRMIEALNNVGLRVNNREFARLVAGTGGMY
jgi:phage-related protein